MRRNGGWTIELSTSIDGVDKIELTPVSLDHTIRWARKEIPSVLALIAELSGVREATLKKLTGNDTDRIFLAFSCLASGTIKEDFSKGSRPLATPPELMAPEDQYAELDQNDEVDPRFPKVNEPIQRFVEPQTAPAPASEPEPQDIDMIGAPQAMKKVG